MIKIVAKFTVQSSKKERFLALASELIQKSREEDGNLSYLLHQDMKHPNNYLFIEQWQDQQAIDSHNESPHFRAFIAKTHEFQASPADISFWQEVNC